MSSMNTPSIAVGEYTCSEIFDAARSLETSGLLRNQRHPGVLGLGAYNRCHFIENGFRTSCVLPEVRVF